MARLSAMPAGTRGRLWAMILLLVAAGGIYFLVAAPLLSGGSPASRPLRRAPGDPRASARAGPSAGRPQWQASSPRSARASPSYAQRRTRAGLIFLAAIVMRSLRPICKNASESWRPPSGPLSPAARTCPRSRAALVAASAFASRSTMIVRPLAALEAATPPLVTAELHIHNTIRQISAPEPWRIENGLRRVWVPPKRRTHRSATGHRRYRLKRVGRSDADRSIP